MDNPTPSSTFHDLPPLKDLEMAPLVDYDHDGNDQVPGGVMPRDESSLPTASLGDTSPSTSRLPGHLVTITSLLRHRNSTLQDEQPSATDTHLVNGKIDGSRLGNTLLLGPHSFRNSLPLLHEPSHKEGDFRGGRAQLESNPGDSIARLRSRDQLVLHFLLELAMLRQDWPVICFGILFQWFHLATTNLAYYYHARLSAAQRIPLEDIMFDVLPPLTGSWWMASEYMVHSMIVIVVFLMVSVLLIRWNPPHKRPLYCVQIARRFFLSVVAAQALRIISFLITTLPGSSRQCAYQVPANLTLSELLHGPAPSEGNPKGWTPPKTMSEVLFRFDVTKGCGDLMFSSHTIFTVTFICIVFHYFNWRLLKWSMVGIQLVTIPFILAARKHYSVDIFTALYAVPLLYYYLKHVLPDKDATSCDLARYYGIRFYRTGVVVWGHDFHISPYDLPVDLQQPPPAKSEGTDSTDSSFEFSEVDPMIV